MGPIRILIPAVSLLLLIFASTTLSVPLEPRIAEKLVEYERLDAWIELVKEGGALGMGDLPVGGAVITAGRPSVTLRLVALLVSFPNRAGMSAYPLEKFEQTLFKGTGKKGRSVAAFYAVNSDGALNVEGSVFGWFDLPQELAYYAAGRAGLGQYPQNSHKLVEDALAAARDVPFGKFDAFGREAGEGDGVVDVLVVIHSSRGMESTGELGNLWSHSGKLPAPVEVGGVKVSHYVVAPVTAPVGLLAYEIARILGAPDLGDPSYGSSGLGTWSLMSSGMWAGGSGDTPSLMDAYSRVHLGFATPVDVTGERLKTDLGCGLLPPPVFRLYPGGIPGPEYFMVECRWRKRFDQRVPGEGVLIYHVDERVPDNRFVSCGPSALHARVAVEQADGLCELEAGLPAEANDLWVTLGGNRFVAQDFDDFSSPAPHNYEGERTGVAVRDLKMFEGALMADLYTDFPLDLERVPGITVRVAEGTAGNTVAEIEVQIAHPGLVQVRVRDLSGNTVWERETRFPEVGRHMLRWDPSETGMEASGMYFVEVQTSDWWDICRVRFP